MLRKVIESFELLLLG